MNLRAFFSVLKTLLGMTFTPALVIYETFISQ